MHKMIPVLLIIDMQKGMALERAGRRNNPQAEANIERLLAAWRERGATVVHVRHISRSPESLFWPGQPGAEFQDALKPLANEHVVEKNVPDAFALTGLERWLHVRDVDSLVIVGVSTNYSVESTARSAGCLGFKTWVVSDAVFAFEKTDYTGKLRTAAEVHDMSLANLDGEFAQVIDTQAALALL